MEQLIPILLENGLLGVIILVLGWAYREKDKQLQAAQEKERESLLKMADDARQQAGEMHASIATIQDAMALIKGVR